MLSRAKGMLGQAAAMNAEAQQFQAVAQSITQQIPTYPFAAAAAANRATALANPKDQPPPPLPMLAQMHSSEQSQSNKQQEELKQQNEELQQIKQHMDELQEKMSRQQDEDMKAGNVFLHS